MNENHKPRMHQLSADADLTCSQNTSHLPYNRLIATQIRRTIEDEAHIEPKEITFVTFLVEELDGEADNLMFPRRTCYKATT